MYEPDIPMRKRAMGAVWAFVINVIVWIVVPYYVGSYLAGKVPETPITSLTFVYEFGVLFIVLDVGAALFRGKAIAVPFISGAALLSAVYLWLVTNGGDLSISTSGIEISLGFTLLLYILILPSIWGAIRAPISYMLWRRAALSRPAPQPSPA